MGRLTALALRSVIVALLVGSVCLQGVMGVLLFREGGGVGGAAGFPRVPVALIIVLGVVCAETVLVCVWRLLTMARGGTVFSRPAFRYVDGVTGAFGGAAVLLWALGAVLAPGEAVAPGIVLLIGVAGLAVLGVALIVLVLRVLLAQAVARDIEASRMQAELAGVI
ncbi:DUF2975 domain-containing protein [Streptomyces sp. SID9124]|uniref:DUF2975 domain-containing protein n=1 Tax=Streptomyces sp. SID9124 TaxID=2706108 RepID=UPI0013DF6DA6|nr:DUF2975 domain-containing protein [Streptomyces sp. SID9124]NED13930.1 DUF2975 domain-containing protein [Streptomyces sp. SID9124]